MEKTLDSCLDCAACEKNKFKDDSVVLFCLKHKKVIGVVEDGSKKIYSLEIPDFCTPKAKLNHAVYNKKDFLCSSSILSMASYHAKLFEDGKYMFRIHDCNTGIRLRGDLNDYAQVEEAVMKLKVLEEALSSFRRHIESQYLVTPFP